MTAAVARPVGVTILSLLIAVTGIGLLVRAIVGLVDGGEGEAGILVSVILLVVGVVYLLVARGIWRGSRAARVVVAVVTVFALVGSVLSLTEPGELWIALVQILVCAVILFLLFDRRSRAFFAGS